MKDRNSFLAASLVLVLSSPMLTGDDRLYPPHSVVLGKSMGEWGAMWWQWVMAIPNDQGQNPAKDQTGAFAHEGQGGPVFFFAGYLGKPPGPIFRASTIPGGKPLFFPLVNALPIRDLQGCDIPLYVRKAVDFIDQTKLLKFALDGIPLLEADLFDHRETFQNFKVTLPPIETNVLGIAGGEYECRVHDGYYLMLKPLPPGHHVLKFEASVGDPAIFTQEINYDLTVEEVHFRRGDADGSGILDITDAIALAWIFLARSENNPG